MPQLTPAQILQQRRNFEAVREQDYERYFGDKKEKFGRSAAGIAVRLLVSLGSGFAPQRRAAALDRLESDLEYLESAQPDALSQLDEWQYALHETAGDTPLVIEATPEGTAIITTRPDAAETGPDLSIGASQQSAVDIGDLSRLSTAEIMQLSDRASDARQQHYTTVA